MRENYNHVQPVGQYDDYSCWAASLKFWYKAAHGVKKSQQGLIDKYNHKADDDGAMGELGLIHIMTTSRMYPSIADPAQQFTADEVRKLLRDWGPIFVAYKSSASRFKHVVVIHGIEATDIMPRVNVMDPGAKYDHGTQKYVGQHLSKSLTEYNWFDRVIYGREK